MRRHRTLAVLALLGPFCLLFAGCFLAPIGYALYQSLLKVERSGPLGLGSDRSVFAGAANYAAALRDDEFTGSVVRVLLFGVVQVPLMIVLAVVLALLLESASARWVPFFRSAFFLPHGVPGVIASILWGFLYVPGISPIVKLLDDLGLQVNFLSSGTVLWSIANIVTWQFAGYNMLIVIAQLKAVRLELYEAAKIDGANAWQLARYLKLPMARPAIVLTTVFSIIGTLQLFSEPLVLRPLTVAVNDTYTPNLNAYTQAFVNNNYNLAAAEAVLLALVACVLSFGFLRLVGRQEDE
ncbi:multiple sugar transport system permease protein [Kribbella antiqua]|uniref:Multiple sugar transport system permease protein n=1 Tax=Kribbella antiqua TaxID=2512217 RepID=A0A4R2IJT6_9ACTN|nr:sugar ABC transporter permease [Kribbella antiqua]TCO45194.1 multiple sugar transport system permease protein [Kribbella antiqua]